ncbi:MAG TPA: methyltransferase domain-containing protein [Devosiaceae bacterium]|jgi:SAM-dependent methyltransferase|nr:methyltransferase domain-containing protein [Devosiaceae bacterium]
MNNERHRYRVSRSWDAVADWYNGWSGPQGSRHHRTLAIPLAMELLQLRPGERVVDLGCGPGAMAPAAARAGATLVGVDSSQKLIATARLHHRSAEFLLADVTQLPALPALAPGSFDAALFLLSIQDIDPLGAAIATSARLLKPGGRLALVMLHPCFRVPRQSGWGWDDSRSLQFRRLDSYLSPLAVPMQQYGGKHVGTTRSYHRPLGTYVEALAAAGLTVTAIREVPGMVSRGSSRAERRAAQEFPLLLGLSARLAR